MVIPILFIRLNQVHFSGWCFLMIFLLQYSTCFHHWMGVYENIMCKQTLYPTWTVVTAVSLYRWECFYKITLLGRSWRLYLQQPNLDVTFHLQSPFWFGIKQIGRNASCCLLTTEADVTHLFCLLCLQKVVVLKSQLLYSFKSIKLQVKSPDLLTLF